jgi:isopenicillin-N epimerase
MLHRREFLGQAGMVAALLGMPMKMAESAVTQSVCLDQPPLPAAAMLETDPERYWAELRRQWLLAADHINLNCGSVGCTPLPVLRAMIEHILSAEEFRDPAYPWFGYEENTRIHELRDSLSAFIGVNRDELAIVRNATEANNVVANGLDMAAGDEVLLTDQEHPGGHCPWDQRVKRHGIKINYVALPKPPTSTADIVDRFERALTPRTKMIFFSHITTVTGVILPAKEICAMARQHGVLTHVDGAHAIGQVPLNLHDMGCDFYGSSPHKWLMAPKGTGFLYIREENMDRLWVNIATANWDNKDMKAYRYSWFGTSNLSVMVGLKAALEFFQQIGAQNIYARQHQLATQVRDQVVKHPQAKVVNASADRFFGGMVSLEPVPAVAVGATTGGLKPIADACAARNIRIAGGPERLRVSTNIFTQQTELFAFYDAMDAALRTPVAA